MQKTHAKKPVSARKVKVGGSVQVSPRTLRTVSGASRAIIRAHEKAFRELGDR